ncbi:hypothetical protein [Roseiterribacter gracilis]|uniref:Uncharacterized protein n=1 Tax=Roseiterribacter gracilis TaxID=2812848 RepID=A0A8S8XAH4_9PROT|nr:hypothetical protein TMPK1_05520 [Rhodospirillales bacterium TMPK1]
MYAETDWRLTEDGAGPLRFGMTLTEVARIAGPLSSREEQGSDCEHRVATRAPKNLILMFNDERLVRIDVGQPDVHDDHGMHVGSKEDEILHTYRDRKIAVSPHPYLDEDGHYVTVFGRKPDRRLVFETEKGVVTSFRTGLNGPAQFIEGCL